MLSEFPMWVCEQIILILFVFMRAQLRADVAGNTFNMSVQAAKLQAKHTTLQQQIDNW